MGVRSASLIARLVFATLVGPLRQEEARRPRAPAPARARFALGVGVACFFAGQLALTAYLDAHPELRDPEYGTRLAYLRARLAEVPGRPLLLILGSSRAEMGLRPAALDGLRAPDGRRPVAFNFALLGSGPLRELMVLRRLLAEGVRPDWVLIEVWPRFAAERELLHDEEAMRRHGLRPADWGLVRRYFADRPAAVQQLCEEWIAPASGHRDLLMERFAPDLLPRGRPPKFLFGEASWRTAPDGWLPFWEPPPSPEARARHLDEKEVEVRFGLHDFRVSPVADRSLRELLALCRRERIAAAVVRMPVGSRCRGWIAEAAGDSWDRYLTGVCRDAAVPLFDTRDWADDADFLDDVHLLAGRAGPYTERLGRELLQPWLDGGEVAACPRGE